MRGKSLQPCIHNSLQKRLRQHKAASAVASVSVMIIIIVSSLINSVYSPPLPVGDTAYVQTNPFESRPTNGVTSGVVGLVGTIANAMDGDFSTQLNWRIGGAPSSIVAYVEMAPFSNTPPATFSISWVDIKINYRAAPTTDDRYRIVYQVAPSATWQVLQSWTNGASARFDKNGNQDERAWSKVSEPNDGVWNWTDIGNIKVRVETQRQGVEDSASMRFYFFDVWLTVYSSSYPPAGKVSIQAPTTSGLEPSKLFFIDVFVTNVTELHGIQFLITYDTTVLTGVEYFAYNPFIFNLPSEINDNPWGNGTGYAAVSFTSWLGDPVGFNGDGPVVRIYFIVDSEGASALHFSESELSNIHGLRIPHIVIDGSFKSRSDYDITVTSLTSSKTIVGQGYNTSVTAMVENLGNYTETFDMTLYVDSGQPVSVTGLVGYWKLDEGTGSTIQDSSGNNNIGTLINGPFWVDGKFGKALSFEGTDDYVEVNNSQSLNMTGNQFSISAWINPRTQSYSSGDIITKRFGSLVQYNIAWSWNGSHVGFGTGLYNGNGVSFEPSRFHPQNNWYHVVSIYNGIRLRLYVNSQLEIDRPVAGNLSPLAVPLHIGWTGPADAGSYFNGTIDNVKIYNRALNEEEIRGVAVQTKTITLGSGASAPLTFRWDTTGFAKGNYTLTAYATPVQGETRTMDNTHIGNTVVAVATPGDVNNDEVVNIVDAAGLSAHFSGPPAGPLGYDPNFDINSDGSIDVVDVGIVSAYWTGPPKGPLA